MIVEHVESHDGRPATLRRPHVVQLELNRGRLGFVRRHMGDIAASGLLLAISLALTLAMVLPVHAFIRGDWLAQFFPVYPISANGSAHLTSQGGTLPVFGHALCRRSGVRLDVPACHGDLCATSPPESATAAYIGLHIVAALVLYAFARLLGLSVEGGSLGRLFAFAWVAPASGHLVIFFPVAIWLIVALVGAAGRPRRHMGRAALELAAGCSSRSARFSRSGSDSRTVRPARHWRLDRLPHTTHPGTSFSAQSSPVLASPYESGGIRHRHRVVGCRVLPRLMTVEQSNLAGGVYDLPSAWDEAQTGFSTLGVIHEVLGGYTGTLWWYVGATALALALMAPAVARSWRPMLFFVVVAVGALILSLAERTPLHVAAYTLLPRFEGLHEHSPQRVLILLAPMVAILAAAMVSCVTRWAGRAVLLAVAALPAALVLAVGAPRFAASYAFARVHDPRRRRERPHCLLRTDRKSAHEKKRSDWVILLALWDPAGRIALRGFPEDPRLERSLEGYSLRTSNSFCTRTARRNIFAKLPGRRPAATPASIPPSSRILPPSKKSLPNLDTEP